MTTHQEPLHLSYCHVVTTPTTRQRCYLRRNENQFIPIPLVCQYCDAPPPPDHKDVFYLVGSDPFVRTACGCWWSQEGFCRKVVLQNAHQQHLNILDSIDGDPLCYHEGVLQHHLQPGRERIEQLELPLGLKWMEQLNAFWEYIGGQAHSDSQNIFSYRITVMCTSQSALQSSPYLNPVLAWLTTSARQLETKWPDAQPLVLYMSTGRIHDPDMKTPSNIMWRYSEWQQFFLIFILRQVFIKEHLRAVNQRRPNIRFAQTPSRFAQMPLPAIFLSFDPRTTLKGVLFLRRHHILAQSKYYTPEMYPSSACTRAALDRGMPMSTERFAQVASPDRPILFYSPDYGYNRNSSTGSPYDDVRVQTMLKALTTEKGLYRLAFIHDGDFDKDIPPEVGGRWNHGVARGLSARQHSISRLSAPLDRPYIGSFGQEISGDFSDANVNRTLEDDAKWISYARRKGAEASFSHNVTVWHWTEEASRGLHLEWKSKHEAGKAAQALAPHGQQAPHVQQAHVPQAHHVQPGQGAQVQHAHVHGP
jgi:hypothetical protein